MFNKEMECLSLDHLRNIQNERLSSLVRRVYSKVPFYKKQYDQIGLTPQALDRGYSRTSRKWTSGNRYKYLWIE